MTEEARGLVLDQLAYLENMARLDDFHPDFQYGFDVIRRAMNCDQELCEERPVTCYTFRQILDMVNASACEVLHIDAEGADCEIVESMGDFCSMWGDTQRWPRILKFETRGFANTWFNPLKEDQTIELLQWWGYHVVYSGNDTVLLHGPTLSCDSWFRDWADATYTFTCETCHLATEPSDACFGRHTRKARWQWKNNIWRCAGCVLGETGYWTPEL